MNISFLREAYPDLPDDGIIHKFRYNFKGF